MANPRQCPGLLQLLLLPPLLLLLLLRPAPCYAGESNNTPGAGPCYKQETYNATVETMVTVQVNKTKYDWCLGGFMRCQVFKLENVDRLQNVTQVHTRNIETCCPGTEPTRPPVPGKNVSLHCVPILPPTTTSTTTTTTTTTTMATTARRRQSTTPTTLYPTTRPTMPPPNRPKPTTVRTTPTTTTTTTTTTTSEPTTTTTTTEAPTPRETFTTPRETCRIGLWGRGCPYECNCGVGWPCDQGTGACPDGAPGPTTPSSPPTTPPTTTTTIVTPSRAVTVAVGGPSAGPGGGMKESDDVPLHIALSLLCIVLLALAVAAVNRRRIAKFMNSGDDGWDSDNAVRCTAVGEDARTSGTPLGLMWGDYDTPPSPVAVIGCNGIVRDPLAEQLAAQTAGDLEHIYQEIRPHGHQNGGPVALRAPKSSEAFQ